MKQYFYEEDMVGKNYLASYAEANLAGDRLFLINTLTDRQMMLGGDRAALKQLFISLQNGISDDGLELALSRCNAGGQLETLLREGLVE